jgi:hypothetical protein
MTSLEVLLALYLIFLACLIRATMQCPSIPKPPKRKYDRFLKSDNDRRTLDKEYDDQKDEEERELCKRLKSDEFVVL